MSLTFISTAWTAPLNLTPISNGLLLISTWMGTSNFTCPKENWCSPTDLPLSDPSLSFRWWFCHCSYSGQKPWSGHQLFSFIPMSNVSTQTIVSKYTHRPTTSTTTWSKLRLFLSDDCYSLFMVLGWAGHLLQTLPQRSLLVASKLFSHQNRIQGLMWSFTSFGHKSLR